MTVKVRQKRNMNTIIDMKNMTSTTTNIIPKITIIIVANIAVETVGTILASTTQKVRVVSTKKVIKNTQMIQKELGT